MSRQDTAEPLATWLAAEEEVAARGRGAPLSLVTDGAAPGARARGPRPGGPGRGAAQGPRRTGGPRQRTGPTPSPQLKAQDAGRVPEFVPIRYGRMAVSPFAFYPRRRGMMAADLAGTPATGIGAGLRRCHLVELRSLRHTGAAIGLRHQRLRRDAARAVGVGRQAVRGSFVIAARERATRREQGRDGACRRPRLPEGSIGSPPRPSSRCGTRAWR